jgi:hypothetical protein
VSHILHLLDSMAYAKLNVLHWHMSDTESFPLQSFKYPKMWDGAYSNDERYLQSEVRSVRGPTALHRLDAGKRAVLADAGCTLR